MNNEFFEHVLARLATFGATGHVEGRYLHVGYNGVSNSYRLEDGYNDAFKRYIALQDCYFDTNDYTFQHNSCVDVPLTRVHGDLIRETEFAFTAQNSDQVVIGRASINYALAFFDSEAYEKYFHAFVVNRIMRATGYPRSINAIFRFPVIASYTSLLATAPFELKFKGVERVRACLAKLAIEQHLCFDVATPTIEFVVVKSDLPVESDGKIPDVVYERNLINFYKVGRSSPFPSQSFLAYYHVLEYFFLRIAESSLHDRMKALLNAPSFQTSSDGIDKAIAIVTKHQTKNDEVEMLRNVLQKFVAEDDFVDFVKILEINAKESVYTKKKMVFGEQFDISLREGHAIANAAKLLKHVRNAIVHSSDRYARDDCHIPLTDSEGIIRRYIPIVKFFAEQVIYGTAMPMT